MKTWLTNSSVWCVCSTNWETALSVLAPELIGSHFRFPSSTFRIMSVIIETLKGCLNSGLHRRKPSQLASMWLLSEHTLWEKWLCSTCNFNLLHCWKCYSKTGSTVCLILRAFPHLINLPCGRIKLRRQSPNAHETGKKTVLKDTSCCD